MYRPNNLSRFFALVSAAILLCAPWTSPAQAPAVQEPPAVPAAQQPPAQPPPVQAPPAVPAAQQPPAQPLTPEQEGDLLLNQKRYQAAIAAYDKIDKIRGMELTVVTTAKTDNQAAMLLEMLGMPFRKG